jgi:galactose oxidase-like protein
VTGVRRLRACIVFIPLALVLLTGDAGTTAAGKKAVEYERMIALRGVPTPFPRDAFGVAAGNGNSLYLFGGVYEYFNSDTPLYDHFGDLWKFTWRGRHALWERVHDCDQDDLYCTREPCEPVVQGGCDFQLATPSSRAFPAMAALVDRRGRRFLALFGGTVFTKTFQNFPRLDSFWLFDVSRETWRNLTPLPGAGPGPRNGSVGVADGDRFYVFGGIDASLQTYNDLWMFDLRTMSWTPLSPNDESQGPHTRHASHGALVTYRGAKRLIIYGGEYLDTQTASFAIPIDTWEFVLAKRKWAKLIPPGHNIKPTRNYAAAVSNAGGNLFVLQGGDVEGGVHGCGALFFEDPTNEVWVFDRSKDRWDKVPLVGATRPPGAKRHGGVQVGKYMYVMGGWEFVCTPEGVGPGQVFNREVYRFLNE